MGFSRRHQGHRPPDDDDDEEDDNVVEDNEEVEDNDKDDNNFKDISALGLELRYPNINLKQEKKKNSKFLNQRKKDCRLPQFPF